MSVPERTIVHLIRHGEVYNPEGLLYGRRDGFHLSPLGNKMAERVAETLGGRDIVHMRTSPLERARETAAPLASTLGLTPTIEPRVIESTNRFEGIGFGDGAMTFVKRPSLLRHMYNPFKPSWGEAYDKVTARMMEAVVDARDAARGHEAVVVSHQLPIWITRLFLEKRSYLHNPKNRQCTLCSVTSLHYEDDVMRRVAYSEPAADLIPVGDRSAPFSAGGAKPEDRP